MKNLVRMQFGSHVYGTNVPASDHDFKAVHLPDGRDILLQRPRNTINLKTNLSGAKNTAEDVDFESFSLQQYLKLLLEGQTVALTMLFTPDRWIIDTSEEWEMIRASKSHFLHRGVSAFAGYCRQQANKYGVKGSRVAATRVAVTTLDHLIQKHGHLTKMRDVWPEIEAMVGSGIEHMAIVAEVTPRLGGSVRMLDVCNRKAQE